MRRAFVLCRTKPLKWKPPPVVRAPQGEILVSFYNRACAWYKIADHQVCPRGEPVLLVSTSVDGITKWNVELGIVVAHA